MENGFLLREAKANALASLDIIGNKLMVQSGTEFIPIEIINAKEKLTKFAKKNNQKRHVVCAWKVGDVYTLKLEGEYPQMVNLSGNYLLIRVIDTFEAYGNVYPHCYLSVHQEQILPTSADEIATAKYLPADRDCSFRFLLTAVDERDYLKFDYLGSFPSITPPLNENVCPKHLLHLGRVPLPIDRIEEIACKRFSFFILGKELNV